MKTYSRIIDNPIGRRYNMLDKIKQKFEKVKDKVDPTTSSSGSGHKGTDWSSSGGIGKKEVYRNRYNYGVNLGGLFVLENWIYDGGLDKGGDSEFDAVNAQAKESSVDEAAKKLQDHYKDYIGKIDWNWLKNEAGVTAFRVPVGYWHVGNGQFVDDLPFGPLKEVYSKAQPWDFLKQLIKKAGEYDIGILVDIHGLPGGANTDSHSGSTGGSAAFFNTSKYVDKMVKEAIPFIVKDACTEAENVIGLQIVNEAAFDNNAKGQKNYYSQAISAIRDIDSGLPVVISDGWWPQQWADWLKDEGLDANVVIDSHVYRCFSDEDKSKDAGKIIDDLSKSVNFPKDQADFTCGEFSCVLDGQTWEKTSGARDELIKQYGCREIDVFSKTASWGWFFWTLQFKHGDGGEWGFVPMVNKGAISCCKENNGAKADENRVQDLVNDHVNYWSDKGGDKMEHWRFEDALRAVINDVKAFAQFDNSRLGRWRAWGLQRRSQYINEKGDGEFMWEWDQGWQRGIEEFVLR